MRRARCSINARGSFWRRIFGTRLFLAVKALYQRLLQTVGFRRVAGLHHTVGQLGEFCTRERAGLIELLRMTHDYGQLGWGQGLNLPDDLDGGHEGRIRMRVALVNFPDREGGLHPNLAARESACSPIEA